MLKSINQNDIELLRQWKNENRNSFFHKEYITEEQQKQWFTSFSQRKNDYMFLVYSDGKPIGCMGIRLLDHVWDVYNVIRGIGSGNGIMSRAMKYMLSHFKYYPITVKVLVDNKAVKWYKKNCFVIQQETETYYTMIYKECA